MNTKLKAWIVTGIGVAILGSTTTDTRNNVVTVSASSTAPTAEAPVRFNVHRFTAALKKAQAKKHTTTQPKNANHKIVQLYPVTALGSQKTIDQGKLVTWMTSPTCLLAGHNNRGWSWIDDLKNGTQVRVHTGPCRGTYVVYARRSQSRKGGPIPAWMSDAKLDLVLQTCKTHGMGFSLLQRTK